MMASLAGTKKRKRQPKKASCENLLPPCPSSCQVLSSTRPSTAPLRPPSPIVGWSPLLLTPCCDVCRPALLFSPFLGSAALVARAPKISFTSADGITVDFTYDQVRGSHCSPVHCVPVR